MDEEDSLDRTLDRVEFGSSVLERKDVYNQDFGTTPVESGGVFGKYEIPTTEKENFDVNSQSEEGYEILSNKPRRIIIRRRVADVRNDNPN